MGLLNRNRAEALMRQCGLDAIVASSPRNVLYLSDYFCWLDPLAKAYYMRPGAPATPAHHFAVLPLAAAPALIVSGMWAANAGNSWIEDLWVYGAGDLDLSAVPQSLTPASADLLRRIAAGRTRADGIDALRIALRERGLAGGRIGIEMEGLSDEERQRLRAALPRTELRDCSNLLRLIRAVKSLEEVRRLERAAQIGYNAAAACLRNARPGQSLHDLRQHYASEIVAAGASVDHFIASPQGVGLVEEPDYRLAPGDILYIDYGCVYEHYYSDNGTTLVLGDFPSDLRSAYGVLRNGLECGIERLQPGVRASEVRQVMVETLAHAGVTGSNAHGHGIGLEPRDYPIIMPPSGLSIRDDCIDLSSDMPLEAEMVVNLELPLYLFGRASLHMEQTFEITPGGPRRLDASDPTEPVHVMLEAARV
jgi:Xaa-Pro dipeptidase